MAHGYGHLRSPRFRQESSEALPTLQALYVGSTLKFSLEQRHDVISTTFQRCSNVRCPLGREDGLWLK